MKAYEVIAVRTITTTIQMMAESQKQAKVVIEEYGVTEAVSDFVVSKEDVKASVKSVIEVKGKQNMSSLQQKLDAAEWSLQNAGFRRCDIPACNCDSWHQVGGFKARFDEIKEVVEEAGYSTNGRTLLDAVKAMAWDLDDARPAPAPDPNIL